MTKRDLIRHVADELIVTREDARLIVSTVFESIIGALHQGERVVIRGFGSFRLQYRPARMARIPVSGAKVKVPAGSVPKFSASKRLREAVSGAVASGE